MEDKHNVLIWEERLNNFKQALDKELQEIQQCKAELAEIQKEVQESLSGIRYIREEGRLVLSAPEIVIGDVDPLGVLGPRYSKVIIRGNEVKVEGTSRILNRAPEIHSLAEHPGRDGQESTLPYHSEIVQVARNVLVNGVSDAEVINPNRDMVSQPGVAITSRGSIDVNASVSCEYESQQLDQAIQALKNQKCQTDKQIADIEKEVKAASMELDLLLKLPDVNVSDTLVRVNYLDISELHEEYNQKVKRMCEKCMAYYSALATQADTNLRIAALEKQKETVEGRKANFEEQTTGSSIYLQSELIRLETRDGDNQTRTNPEAGFFVNSSHISLTSYMDDWKTIEESYLYVGTQKATISTQNYNYSDPQKGEGEVVTEGEVNILSKTVRVQAVDADLKEFEPTEKALTPESQLTVRMEQTQVQATDTEGKATGLIDMNAKNLRLKSMDVDKESGEDSALAQGSQLQLLSESMFIGSTEDKQQTLLAQVAADRLKLFAKTENEWQLDEDKGLLRLKEGTATFSSKGLEFWGKTTFNDQAQFTVVQVGDVKVDNIDVSKSSKTPHTSDGMPGKTSPKSDQQKSDHPLEEPAWNK
ncbi:MAG: hypothetical protein SOY43_03295 [Parabacteroides sp.]|nr:hypothetical protein [bacterium]MDY4101908.1 hypothetical protein [Parabacteroides sp.]